MSEIDQSAIPTPSQTEHDETGRLVGIRIDRRNTAAADGNAWLVAIDGSAHSVRAAGEAIQLAREMKSCTLHLAHIQPWMSKEAAAAELTERGWAATAQARALLDAESLPWCLHIAMGECAERLVDLAEKIGCRGIVVGSRGLGAAKSLLLGSVAQRVIHLSPVPVMVVR